MNHKTNQQILKEFFRNNSPLAEKFLLLEVLMINIRGDYSIPADKDPRVKRCIQLAFEFYCLHYDMVFWKTFQRMACYSTGRFDGRYLRATFSKDGGYEGMKKYHGLNLSKVGRSFWFKAECKKYITIPDQFPWAVKIKP